MNLYIQGSVETTLPFVTGSVISPGMDTVVRFVQLGKGFALDIPGLAAVRRRKPTVSKSC